MSVYRDDLVAAQARIAALEAENRRLRDADAADSLPVMLDFRWVVKIMITICLAGLVLYSAGVVVSKPTPWWQQAETAQTWRQSCRQVIVSNDLCNGAPCARVDYRSEAMLCIDVSAVTDER